MICIKILASGNRCAIYRTNQFDLTRLGANPMAIEQTLLRIACEQNSAS
jgi:hypothetical protein